MTETQFKNFISNFNSFTKELIEENEPLVNVCGHVVLMHWIYQLGESTNTVLLREYMRSFYDTGSFQFDPEPLVLQNDNVGGNYL